MRVVLLDLDGTLVDSLPGIAAGINDVLGTAYALDEIRPFVGPPLQRTFGTLTGATGEELDDVVARYRAGYGERHMLEGTMVYDGVPELLDALVDGGWTLAVATSKARPLARKLLAALGLASRFAAIEGPVPPSHDLKAATIAAALRALGIAPSDDVVMVGDRAHDVEGAAEHGLRTIGVTWGFGSRDELTSAGAVALAERPADVAALLAA